MTNKRLRGDLCFLREKLQFFHSIEYPVYTKRETHARQIFLIAKGLCEVVVPSAATDTSDTDVIDLDFKDTACVVAQAAGDGLDGVAADPLADGDADA